MPESVAVDGPPVANGAATISTSALALHLDCARTYIGKLEADGVIQRQSDGFPLDQSRVAYLRYLRRERRQSRRSEAAADHVEAKTEMLQLRLMEKRRHDALIDQLAGITLTHLSGVAARCSNDLVVRRKIDAVVYEVRKEIAKVAIEMADKIGEPLDP